MHSSFLKHYRISAWSKSRNPDALKQAETLIQMMEGLTKMVSGNDANKSPVLLVPDSITYSILLHLLSRHRTRDAMRAQEIYDQINPQLLDTYTVNCLLSCWARSYQEDKAVRVKTILQQISNSDVNVDIISYNTALNACAFTKGSKFTKNDALNIAMELFDEIFQPDNNLKANELTYSTILKACINLSESTEERLELMRPILQLCHQDRLIGKMVLKEINFAFSDEVGKSLLDSVKS